MMRYNIELIFRYSFIEATIEARSKEQALKDFWKTVTEQEGLSFAMSAQTFGNCFIRRVDI